MLMLKYLYSTVENLLIAVTLITLIAAVVRRTYGRRGRPFLWAGGIAGFLASAALAAARMDLQANRQLNTWLNISQQAIWTTLIIITGSLGFLILLAFFGRKDCPDPETAVQSPAAQGAAAEGAADLKAGGAAVCVFAAIAVFGLTVREMPGIISDPINFDTMGKGVISEEWFLRLAGWLLALILLALYARWLYRGAVRLKSRGTVVAVTAAALLSGCFRVFAIILRYWTANIKQFPWPVRYDSARFPWASDLTIFASSNILFFSALVAGIAMIIPLKLFIDHIRVTEPYDNPAQLRRHRFNNRKLRRMAVRTLAVFAVFMVCMTAVKSYATRPVVLSSPESYTVEGDRILIDLDDISDGHLHRFEYVTKKNIAVRWIVIKKPNSAAYGVGLDACDVCGNAGYYERGNQVVCKRCDVVMNIRTIGFPGGCNPIPLNYAIENGKMVFLLEDIIAGESEFKF